MSKIVITLEDADLLELQEILLDADEAAALTFLQTRVAPNIPSKGTTDCDSSRCNPYLLKPEKPRRPEHDMPNHRLERDSGKAAADGGPTGAVHP